MAIAGASVVLIEAGPCIPRWHTVENFRNSPAKSDFATPYPSTPYAPHPEYAPANNYLIQKGDYPYNSQYVRLVGGTTWHWAAAAWRLVPSDFQVRKLYRVGRDWPYQHETLEPWDSAAEVQAFRARRERHRNAEADVDVALRQIPARYRQQCRSGGPQPDGSSGHRRHFPRQRAAVARTRADGNDFDRQLPRRRVPLRL